MDAIAEIISNTHFLSDAGQIVLISEGGYALTPSKVEGDFDVLDPLPEAPHVLAAMAGDHTEFEGITGVTGNNVLAVSSEVQFHGADWGLILEETMDSALAAERRLGMTTVLQVLIMALLVAGLGYFVAKFLTSRILGLVGSVKSIANGDYDAPVAELETGDELGEIARALQEFKGKLLAADKMREDQILKAEQQNQVMEKLRQNLEKLAQGKLDCQLNEPLGDDFEGLRQYFNRYGGFSGCDCARTGSKR